MHWFTLLFLAMLTLATGVEIYLAGRHLRHVAAHRDAVPAPFAQRSVCASLDDEVVHGVPSERVVLKEGDILSVDCGVVYKGFFGDAAETYGVGAISPEAERLLRVTRESLLRGIEQARPGKGVSDIGHAVQQHVEAHRFSVVREFVGHEIGSSLHEDPQVPNFGKPGHGVRLAPGMVLAI